MKFQPAAPNPPHREEVKIPIDPARAHQAMEESGTDEEREVRLMALCLESEEELEQLLKGASAENRAAMLEMIGPYLTFPRQIVEVIPDCPECGLRRGSVIPHACLGAN